MRKPRPQDFDPEYKKPKSPTPENVDMSGIVPIKSKPTSIDSEDQNKTERSDNRTDERTDFRSEKRTAKLPIKRITKRYSFEFYEDQVSRLKQIKYDVEIKGDRITMSEIVREALDNYFEKQNMKPFGNPNERNSERSEIRS